MSDALVVLAIRAALSHCRDQTERMVTVLALAHELDPRAFADVAPSIRGKRLYIAQDRDAIEAAGQSTRPVQIGATGYFVVSNANRARKRSIAASVLIGMGFNSSLVETIIVLI